MADKVIGKPRVVGAAVWLPIRIDGFRHEVGAARAGQWRLYTGGLPPQDFDAATRLAEEWERDHAAELAPLFEEAEAYRLAHKP